MTNSKISRNGFMFILSSPSGAGKTTLSRLLLESDDNLKMSVSCTTRDKREKEIDGVDYTFVSKEEFGEMAAQNAFLESAEVFGNFYGTPEKMVDAALEQGVDVLFDIDWQGTQQVKRLRPDDVVSVFILPPSMEELAKRLNKRGQDSQEVIDGRMAKAAGEISQWQIYDYAVVNNDLDECLADVKNILEAERLKLRRRHGLNDFVKGLLE